MTGDPWAFHELVLRRQARVRTLLARLCGNRAYADDLAQQTFLQAWRSLKLLKSPEAFGSWLSRIAVNTWLQAERAAKPFADSVDDELEGFPDPAACTSRVEARLDLERALAKLTPNQRLCVVLAYAEGLSHPEIAETCGLTVGTVKSHIARGGEKLRRWLAAGGNSD
jgi:RNA polymerase sigma factor (sigma-70 family)